MSQLNDILFPVGGFAGLLGAAWLIRYGVPRAYSALAAWLWMSKDIMSRQWRPRHVASKGRPALVAQRSFAHAIAADGEHQGATVAYGAELEQMKSARRDPLTEWVEDVVSETALRAEERQLARDIVAHFDAVVEPAYVRMQAMVDEVLEAFMAKHGITWQQVDEYPIDVAATEVFAAVDGDIHRLAEELAVEIAVSTPTGEWPVVQAGVA